MQTEVNKKLTKTSKKEKRPKLNLPTPRKTLSVEKKEHMPQPPTTAR